MWRNKTLWSEGLFLRPQHFQQQDRYVERLVAQRVGSSNAFGWGFIDLDIDRPALAAGRLQLNQATGVLPDGTVFRFPDEDPPPDPLNIDPTWKNTLLYLTIVTDRPGVPAATLDESPARAHLRHRAKVNEIADAVEGFNEAVPVQLASLCLRLVPAGELTGAMTALPVARLIERRADNRVVLDDEFIATALSSANSPQLNSWLEELRALLRHRIGALASRLAQPGRGGVAEIADFLLLQTVNRHGALFDHLINVTPLHPERLYSACVELAGDLAIFGGDERCLSNPFPAYEHDDLQRTFKPVADRLRQALTIVLEQHAIPIELQLNKYGVRFAQIADKQLLSSATFVLAVNAQMPPEALRLRLPTQTKIAPSDKIRDLVTHQLPGVPVRALPVAPRQIPYHAGFNYFELDTTHELWRALAQSGSLAMHIAGDFPGIEIEFWAIRS